MRCQCSFCEQKHVDELLMMFYVHHMNIIDTTLLTDSTAELHRNSDDTVLLNLMTQIENNPNISQRTLASDLGIALGLLNSYVKSCVKKGWIRVNQVPAKRFAYFITPEGVSEKSRMVASYLKRHFDFFKDVKLESMNIISSIQSRGINAVKIIGDDELLEIFTLVARAESIKVEVIKSVDVLKEVDCVVILDLMNGPSIFNSLKPILKEGQIYLFKVSHFQKARV